MFTHTLSNPTEFRIYTIGLNTEGIYSLYIETTMAGRNFGHSKNGIYYFEVELVNPCKIATLTMNAGVIIDPTNYFEYGVYPGNSAFNDILAPYSIVYATSSETQTAAACPTINIDVLMSNGDPLDTSVFTYSTTGPQLSVSSTDLSKVGEYILKVTATFNDASYT